MPAIMKPDGSASVTCDICGKPIVVMNKYGTFCEDECELEEAKKAYNEVNKTIEMMENLFDEIGLKS